MFIVTGILHAKPVDAIALIVEGEPVTTAEIRAVEQQTGTSHKEAVDLLIQDRLQKAAMKNIMVPESDIDNEIDRIAKQNGISVKKMQQVLKQQGTSWTKYREAIRNGLKKRKFFQEKVAKTLPAPTEDELKLYYQNHKAQFILPSVIKAVEYTAPTKAKIEAFIHGKQHSGVHHKNVSKQTAHLNPALLSMLMQTPNGAFTAPINAGDHYVVYKVKTKEGRREMPFETAKNAVAARWRQNQQQQALKDYFKKMKTEADIRIIRQ